jgi:hypothetical protein
MLTSVLAADPGGMTGLATWRRNEGWGDLVAWAQSSDEALVEAHMLIASGNFDLVVCESFHISVQTAKKSQDGIVSIKMWGALEYLCSCYDVEFETQSPSDAKMFTTDEKLRALGWWTPGLDHPRDATRHVVLALSRRKAIDLRQLIRTMGI